MFGALGKLAGATIVGLGATAAVNVCEPTIAPTARTSDLTLTATVLVMGGLGYEDVDPALIPTLLGGRYANETCLDEPCLRGLPWPGSLVPSLNASVQVGIVNMDTAIRNTPGPKVVIGASGSTLVVDEEMRALANDSTAPPKDELSFVVLGDANRSMFRPLQGIKLPLFDYTVPEIPVTKYDVLVVAGEYDGLGDWPDRWWNLLADYNALTGTSLIQQIVPDPIMSALHLEDYGSVHRQSMDADLTQVPAKNITVSKNELGGITTTYLVPTPDLPMLRPLKGLGVPQPVIDALEGVLRPIVDSAYYRNDPMTIGSTARPDIPTVMTASSAVARPRAVKAAAAGSAAASSAVAGSGSGSKPTPKAGGRAGGTRAPRGAAAAD